MANFKIEDNMKFYIDDLKYLDDIDYFKNYYNYMSTMKHKVMNAPSLPVSAKILSEAESIAKMNLDNPTDQDIIDAVLGLKNAGWKVLVNPALASGGQKGYQLTLLEPKKNTSK